MIAARQLPDVAADPRPGARLLRRTRLPLERLVARVTGDPLPLRRRPPRDWTPQERSAIAWFRKHRDRTPAAPFELSPGVVVTDRDRFLAGLDRDVSAGPNGCRA
ncbi:MAG TPA: hypothetical protein VF170_14565, partial [Planctomycetaceae bacterium]